MYNTVMPTSYSNNYQNEVIPVSAMRFMSVRDLLNHLMLSKSVRDMRQIASQNGLENMSMAEIDQEIAQYRAEKRGIAPQGAQS